MVFGAVPNSLLKRPQSRLRATGIVLTLVAGFVVAVVWLPPVPALLAGTALALAGVVLLAGPRLRVASLVTASLLASFAGAEGFFGVLAEPALNRNMTKIATPAQWNISDDAVAYRPRPGDHLRCC